MYVCTHTFLLSRLNPQRYVCTYESVMILNITNFTLSIEATATAVTTTTTRDNNKEINIKSQYNNNTSYSNNNQIVVSH